MKYLGVSEAFYAYLRVIADAHSDFNGNPSPMTTSKQEHIISTLPPLFQFIKNSYLISGNIIYDLSIQEFYNTYVSRCDIHYIMPLSKINITRILSNELDINSNRVYIDDGVEDVPQNRPTADPNALDRFLAEIRGTPVNTEPLKVTKTVIQQSSPQKLKCKVITGKSSKKPPVPPKPDHLKTKSTIEKKSVTITKETVTENDPEPPAPETAKKNTIEPLVRDPQPKKAINHFKDWVKYTKDLPVGKLVTGKELVKILETYQENKNAEIIPVSSDYQTMKLDKGKAVEPCIEDHEMECEWKKANRIIDEFDNKGFENICEDLDHYDEAQLPVNGGDPNYFDRFIIYVRNHPPVVGECNGKLNDCLYECLKHIYGTFSKMPKTIEKPEYIKKALGLNRDAPVPVSYMDKVEKLKKPCN
ncbi:hypothetical protein C1646_810619 [Rhizophagus diaphanus]|nr:hypothetical protein C1646_810619 [Rhizophagus diaphanus] [Rhizophagus sp. MUCL 43196]